MTNANVPKGFASVMPMRVSPPDSLDCFPTPIWGTRALCEWITARAPTHVLSVWEPACGLGHMSRGLREYFSEVYSTDIHDYGHNDATIDFLTAPVERRFDWCVTNPPFNRAEAFAKKATAAAHNTALLVRTSFLEGQKRYTDLFSYNPPTDILQFTERLPMVKGRLDRKASTATSYAWLVWRDQTEIDRPGTTVFHWIPPCRKHLEKDSDYT